MKTPTLGRQRHIQILVGIVLCLAKVSSGAVFVGISGSGDAYEAGSPTSVTISASGLQSGEYVLVDLSPSGTASYLFDYTASEGLYSSISVYSFSKYITLWAIDDSTFEGNEYGYLTISSARVYRLDGSSFPATVTSASALFFVIDNDKPPVAITALANAKENPQTRGKVRISRPWTDTTYPLQVTYTLGGTAIGPSPSMDYTLSGGGSSSATIPSGSSYVDVEVVPWYDGYADSNETVIFTITSGPNSGYTLGSPSVATVIIND